MPGPPPRTIWGSLTRPFKVILVAVLAVAGYGIYTWALGVVQGIPFGQPWVSVYGVRSPYLGATATATTILALGTAALAYAAYQQSVATRDQAESTERLRRDQLRPHLSIVLLEPATPGTRDDRPVMASPFFTRVEGPRNMKFAVRNMGPGNAMSVRIECPAEHLRADGPWTGAEALNVPSLSELSPRYVPVEGRALQANESYDFELPVAIPIPPDAGVANATYRILGRIEILAACKDVEGRETPVVHFGLALQQIVPVPFVRPHDALGDNTPRGKGYELLWSEIPRGTPPDGSGWIPLKR
jgi:hypothetical protein